MCSLIVTNAPYECKIETGETGAGYGEVCGNSVLSAPFFCKSKTVLKNIKVINKTNC